ncbi:MAG TPA: DUF1501 domain-containing protein [Pirellulales bacterium]|jgi:hypothetical protein|nr:DUF1501 domain-containing protein [Pirellulales bacterium]
MERFFARRRLSRRELLQSASCGFGYLALASLCTELAASESSNPLAPKPPHFTPHAKRVIFLFMQGAPSHVDTFDYKPQLARDDGKAAPGKGNRKLLKSPFTFKQHGKSGLWLPEIFPELAKHADDLCLLNSLQTDLPNHPQASVQMHTGNFQQTRPSMGAWTLYGLGTENQELPGFITINPPGGAGGAANYGSAFLPAAFQGTRIGGDGGKRAGQQVANLENPRLNPALQRKQLDLLQDLNRERLAKDEVNTELEGVIESYELAFRMEGAVPQVMDYGNESQSTLAAYGIGEKGTDGFGKQCLLARRFAEAGVRFVEISLGNWDQHKNLKGQLTANAHAIDKPIAALMSDLKQRGLFKDTLLVWGGEFGRTPSAQNADGRDHNAKGFSMWLAGGGTKGGIRYGATDEYGVEAVKDPMHIHDLHATLLYLLGLDHERLTYRYSGRDFKLTDTAGNVHKGVVA